VTEEGREGAAFAPNEPFFAKYLLKPREKSRGRFVVSFTPPNEVKICRVVVSFMGRNMICGLVPNPTGLALPEDATTITYAGGDQANTCGQPATVQFEVIV